MKVEQIKCSFIVGFGSSCTDSYVFWSNVHFKVIASCWRKNCLRFIWASLRNTQKWNFAPLRNTWNETVCLHKYAEWNCALLRNIQKYINRAYLQNTCNKLCTFAYYTELNCAYSLYIQNENCAYLPTMLNYLKFKHLWWLWNQIRKYATLRRWLELTYG